VDRDGPFVILANVAITDLEGLRDKARAATRKFGMAQSDHWAEVRKPRFWRLDGFLEVVKSY
jgi:hypothetical protein